MISYLAAAPSPSSAQVNGRSVCHGPTVQCRIPVGQRPQP